MNAFKISLIDKVSIFMSGLIILSIFLIHIINHTYTNYTGIPYFSPSLILLSIIDLAVIYIGVKLVMPDKKYLIDSLTNFSRFYLLVALIALYTSAIQLTPFTPIDDFVLNIDSSLGINTPKLLDFTYHHSIIETILKISYTALTPELFITFILIIFLYEKNSYSQLSFLLLSSALIGFSLYYFLPTVAPASLIQSPFFLNEQHQTHIKFDLIHEYLPKPASFEGGLIAMPSFHCIWAMICQYIIFIRWRWLGYLILPLNICLIAACLLLGWHYFFDIIVSSFIVFPLIIISRRLSR